jgi:hypothetical protein
VILTLVISPALWEGANAQEDWQWSAGFYPGSRPGEIRTGTADSFEAARAAFDKAWHRFAAIRTEADVAEWREQRDWTARKYPARDAGQPCPKR